MSGFELLRSLPWGAIWEAAKVLAEFGLVVFAGTQVWLQRQELLNRERTAFAVVYAEYWRLDARRMDWKDEDLVATAQASSLFHDVLAPPDWGIVVRSLGDLGPESAALGAFAYALLNQVIRSARVLAETKGVGAPHASGRDLEDHIKKVLPEVVTTLEDAMRTAPRRAQMVKSALASMAPASTAGQQLASAYAKGVQQAALSSAVLGRPRNPSGLWATKVGRVLSAIGGALRP